MRNALGSLIALSMLLAGCAGLQPFLLGKTAFRPAEPGTSSPEPGSAVPFAGALEAPPLVTGELASFSLVPDVKLVYNRIFPTCFLVETEAARFAYVAGGASATDVQEVLPVERATVYPNGVIGPFQPTGGSLLRGRRLHSTFMTRGHTYLMGGLNDRDGSIEQAAIRADGSLGPFTLSERRLVTPRSGHNSVVIGDYVYVAGGFPTEGGATSFGLTTIERAQIAPDGALGAFSRVEGIGLATGRSGAAALRIGNFLYVLGGRKTNNAGDMTRSVERATILLARVEKRVISLTIASDPRNAKVRLHAPFRGQAVQTTACPRKR